MQDAGCRVQNPVSVVFKTMKSVIANSLISEASPLIPEICSISSLTKIFSRNISGIRREGSGVSECGFANLLFLRAIASFPRFALLR
jgi:hypothetical protein